MDCLTGLRLLRSVPSTQLFKSLTTIPSDVTASQEFTHVRHLAKQPHHAFMIDEEEPNAEVTQVSASVYVAAVVLFLLSVIYSRLVCRLILRQLRLAPRGWFWAGVVVAVVLLFVYGIMTVMQGAAGVIVAIVSWIEAACIVAFVVKQPDACGKVIDALENAAHVVNSAPQILRGAIFSAVSQIVLFILVCIIIVAIWGAAIMGSENFLANPPSPAGPIVGSIILVLVALLLAGLIQISYSGAVGRVVESYGAPTVPKEGGSGVLGEGKSAAPLARLWSSFLATHWRSLIVTIIMVNALSVVVGTLESVGQGNLLQATGPADEDVDIDGIHMPVHDADMGVGAIFSTVLQPFMLLVGWFVIMSTILMALKPEVTGKFIPTAESIFPAIRAVALVTKDCRMEFVAIVFGTLFCLGLLIWLFLLLWVLIVLIPVMIVDIQLAKVLSAGSTGVLIGLVVTQVLVFVVILVLVGALLQAIVSVVQSQFLIEKVNNTKKVVQSDYVHMLEEDELAKVGLEPASGDIELA